MPKYYYPTTGRYDQPLMAEIENPVAMPDDSVYVKLETYRESQARLGRWIEEAMEQRERVRKARAAIEKARAAIKKLRESMTSDRKA